MIHPNRFAATALFLLLAGCAGSPSQRVPFPAQDVVVTRPDLTRIYFLREDTVGLSNRVIRVLDDETEIGQLNTGTYLCWERPAGRTLGRAFYEATDSNRGRIEGIADLDCAAGSAYYYNVTVNRVEGKPVVSLLDAEEGRRLVSERKPASAR